MKIKRNQSLTIIPLLAAAVLLISCSPGGPDMKIDAAPAVLSGETEISTSVRVTEAVRGDMEERITLSGEVYATSRVNVVPEINGLLTRVLVVPGDRVALDQIVAYVDPSRPGMSYSPSPVRSRTAGTVTSVPGIPGNQVSTQSVIVEVGNLDRLEVDTKVPERYLASLRPGLTAWLTSRAYPDSRVESRIVEISPVVDSRSRTVLVKLEPARTEQLRPGQAVSVDLILGNRPDTLVIPALAITERRDGNGVFVVEGESAWWRQIVVGLNDQGMVEVREGLSEGEAVVVAGYQDITDGSRIKVLGN